jgi:hypothetical protein
VTNRAREVKALVVYVWLSYLQRRQHLTAIAYPHSASRA